MIELPKEVTLGVLRFLKLLTSSRIRVISKDFLIMTTKTYCLITTIFILLVAGCSIEHPLKLDARLPLPPAIKQYPLNIGVYYSPEFVEYTKKIELIGCGPYGRRDKSGIFFTFPIGTATRDLFDQSIANMFKIVTRMSIPSLSSGNTSSVDGVFEPRIESFAWDMVCSNNFLSTGKLSTNVSYFINLYDPEGHLVVSMHVEGRSIEKPKLCFGESCKDSIAAEQAMQDAMAKFMTDFQEQPEVKRWLSTRISVAGKHE
jgi:hypothetical protein